MKFFRSSTTILALVVALVIGYVYFFEYKKTQTEGAAKLEGLKIFQAKEEDVVRITLKWAGGETVLAKNDKGEWLLQVPVIDSAEPTAVSTLLKGITDEASELTVTEDPVADLEIYGLKDPLGSVTIDKKDGTSQAVSFGQVDALDGKKYALIHQSKKVVVVPSFTQTRFVKTVKDLRQKKIAKTSRFDVASITVKTNGTNAAVTKNESVWTYIDKKWLVDSTLVENYIALVENLSAIEFVDENKNSEATRKKYPLNQSIWSVELKTKDGASETLTVHAVQERGALITSSLKNTVYRIAQNSYEPLKISDEYFRDKKQPFQFRSETVESIEIKTGLVQLKLKKENLGWKAEPPIADRTVDEGQVKKLFEDILALRAIKYSGMSSKSLANPMGIIVMRNKDTATEFEIKWGADVSEKERVAMTNKSSEAFTVSKSDLALLPLQKLLQSQKKDTTSTTQEKK